MLNKYKTEPLNSSHKSQFIDFCNQFIGDNYFNENNFEKQIKLSTLNQFNSSLVLLDKNNIIAIRLSYAPGLWQDEIQTQYLNNLDIKLSSVGYFKSLFVHPNYQKQGIGPYLSQQSIKILLQMRAQYIVSHSWLESPNNSSVRYLEKYGFKQLGPIKHFWSQVDYLCSGCKKPKCKCTAIEMLYKI